MSGSILFHEVFFTPYVKAVFDTTPAFALKKSETQLNLKIGCPRAEI
jgi:hypothetical protein